MFIFNGTLLSDFYDFAISCLQKADFRYFYFIKVVYSKKKQ